MFILKSLGRSDVGVKRPRDTVYPRTVMTKDKERKGKRGMSSLKHPSPDHRNRRLPATVKSLVLSRRVP